MPLRLPSPRTLIRRKTISGSAFLMLWYTTLPPCGSHRHVHHTHIAWLFLSGHVSDDYIRSVSMSQNTHHLTYNGTEHYICSKTSYHIFCCWVELFASLSMHNVSMYTLNSLLLNTEYSTFAENFSENVLNINYIIYIVDCSLWRSTRAVPHPSKDVYRQLWVEQDWFDLIPRQHAPHRREAFEDGIKFHLLVCLQITHRHKHIDLYEHGNT